MAKAYPRGRVLIGHVKIVVLVSLETIDLVCECAGPGRGELVSAVWCVRVTGPNYDLHPTAHVLHREQEPWGRAASDLNHILSYHTGYGSCPHRPVTRHRAHTVYSCSRLSLYIYWPG